MKQKWACLSLLILGTTFNVLALGLGRGSNRGPLVAIGSSLIAIGAVFMAIHRQGRRAPPPP